jgi:exonuclease VII small subunit
MAKKINEKIEELNNKVEWFYGDEFKLEEASVKYKEATKLAKEIEEDLKNLKNEIKVIEEDFSKE